VGSAIWSILPEAASHSPSALADILVSLTNSSPILIRSPRSPPFLDHIRRLRCIRPYLYSTTVAAIVISIVYSKLDYCKSLYYNLPKSQLTRLQQIQNSLAHIVVKAPKFCLITPIIRFFHWIAITERIEYKLLSLSHKVLIIIKPPYLFIFLNLIK